MTAKEQYLLKNLDDHEVDIFTYASLAKELGLSKGDWKSVIRRLVDRGYFREIERGKFCRHSFSDEYVIGNYLTKGGVIAYWSALHVHGLTEQIPNTIFVQTSKAKRAKTVFGVSYKFVKVLPRKITGVVSQGFGNHRYRITDPEKTIVDCFDLSEYSGGYAELIRAMSEGRFEQEKFITYCAAINNIAATKRIGYLIELFEKPNMDKFLTFAHNMVHQKYNVFDPFGQEEGQFVKRWKLRMNLPEENILAIVNKVY